MQRTRLLSALAILVGGTGVNPGAVNASGWPVVSDLIPDLLARRTRVSTVVAAGDIASCASSGDEATAEVIDEVMAREPTATVATLGDHVYNSGSPSEFADCYHPSWGRFRDRTKPAPGNHDYGTPGASGYFGYFGAAAGDRDRGYYSDDIGSWHVVVLNSNCWAIGGCDASSPQVQWLRADLAASQAGCTVAYWHQPRFSSGRNHGNDAMYGAFWDALYQSGAELVLNGHDHVYERFAPQRPDRTADPAFGVREFIVGTGGRSHYRFGAPQPNSEVRNGETDGVLELSLDADGYRWQFHGVAGAAFTDAGSGSCHGRPGV